MAARDPDIAAAIQYIQDHFHEPITADDVAAHAGVSARHLLNRMLAETGKSIRNTLASQRIEHAKGLLVATRTKIQLVAQQSGFTTGENMAKVFRRVLGVSPEEYRIQYTVTAAGPVRAIASNRLDPQ
jgi:transcriptional regulator GlxA family with amidase domain